MTILSDFIETRGLYSDIRNTSGDIAVEYKKDFRGIGRMFLRRVAERLDLVEYRISYNAAGIACSGDHILMGMKGEKGIYVSFNTDGMKEILYRSITDMQDFTGGQNNYVPIVADYDEIVSKLEKLLE